MNKFHQQNFMKIKKMKNYKMNLTRATNKKTKRMMGLPSHKILSKN